MYNFARQSAAKEGVELPNWDKFKKTGWFKVPDLDKQVIMMEEFVNNPKQNPLSTPSGKIEIFSKTIADFGYEDCPGHPYWMEPQEWLGNATPDAPLHMISNQPKDKLSLSLG